MNGTRTESDIPGLENSTELEYEGEGSVITQQNKLNDQLFPDDFHIRLPNTGITLKTGNFFIISYKNKKYLKYLLYLNFDFLIF